jgi:hypothetical protein
MPFNLHLDAGGLTIAAYAAFNREDFDAAVASIDPQIEWMEPAEFPILYEK